METKSLLRPPIVVVLGHVDHGKSSLLEAIREDFKITSKESGGITQHIGAYEAEYQGKRITFIDTPGHEVFSAMRQRGAKVADIAVLVVAADEGVKPQTVEAIEQAKKAEIPMVVAVNKIDKPEANVEKVKQELAKHEVFVETYGGTIPMVQTSATTKQGISDLLEMILLVADMGHLTATVEKPGEGFIVEASMDSKRGPAVTVLVKDGTVKIGDRISTRFETGKIKMLETFQGEAVEQVFPSQPARIIGFESCPFAGEKFRVLAEGEEFVPERDTRKRFEISQVLPVDPEAKILNVVVKADVQGSLEALENVVLSLPQDKMFVRLVKGEVGEVNENDIALAQGAKAHILCFRTKISPDMAGLAERSNVQVEVFSIIYELVEKVRELMEKSFQEQETRQDFGIVQVLAVFLVDKDRQIVGGKVVEGEAKKGTSAEIVRGDIVVGKGKILNVQKNKKDMASVSKGEECGLHFEGSEKVLVGDSIKFYIEKEAE